MGSWIMGHKWVNWKTIVISVVYFCITHFWTCKITSSLLNTLGAVKNKTLRFSWITQPRILKIFLPIIKSRSWGFQDIKGHNKLSQVMALPKKPILWLLFSKSFFSRNYFGKLLFALNCHNLAQKESLILNRANCSSHFRNIDMV